MSVGLPSVGFFTDNGGEFANVKLDELTSKLGLMVKFGPAYSPLSNGVNKRNHALADITIKKIMEEHKTPLMDSLIKPAVWTYNTLVNKLGFSPLQLVTEKALTIPGLKARAVASESMMDAVAV